MKIIATPKKHDRAKVITNKKYIFLAISSMFLFAGILFNSKIDVEKKINRMKDEIRYQLISLSGDMGLKLTAVYADGRKWTEREALEKALKVGLGQPILGINTHEIKKNVEALPFVKEAYVERFFPDTLKIMIVEEEEEIKKQIEKLYEIYDGARDNHDKFTKNPYEINDKHYIDIHMPTSVRN